MNGKTHNVHQAYTKRTPITRTHTCTLSVQLVYNYPYTLNKVFNKGLLLRLLTKVTNTCCCKINFATHSIFFQLKNLFKWFIGFSLNYQASGANCCYSPATSGKTEDERDEFVNCEAPLGKTAAFLRSLFLGRGTACTAKEKLTDSNSSIMQATCTTVAQNDRN